MPLTDVDQSGFDWHKHPHTKILLSARIRALKPAHKGMLWMLMEHAALEVPFASLPSDAERLAEMAGVALPVWSKAADAVLGAAFVLCSDNRWYCKLLVDNLAQQVKQADQDTTPSKPKKPVSPEVSEARRQAGLKGKQAQMAKQANADVCQNSDLANFGKTLANAEFCQNDALAKSGKSLANEGDIGGDLDQDLDLENNKHTQSVCEDFTPDLDCLNDKLKMAGAQPVTQEQLSQTLVTFVPHYETHHLTDNQRMGKLVQWIKGDQAKAARPAKSKAKAEQPVYGNVNDHWGNPPPQDLDTGFVMPEELKAKIANLRSVKSS